MSIIKKCVVPKWVECGVIEALKTHGYPVIKNEDTELKTESDDLLCAMLNSHAMFFGG